MIFSMVIQHKINSLSRFFDNSTMSHNKQQLFYKIKLFAFINNLASLAKNGRSNLIRHSFICHFLLVMCAFIISSCFSVKYTMSGASISPEVKTLSIQYFTDRSNSGQSMLSQQFTDNLREKCRRQTNLKIITEGGDVNFESEITGYEIQYTAVESNNTAAKNLLVITIHVKFTNSIDTKLSYDASFSRNQEYSSSETLDQAAPKLIPIIIDELTEDIFNKAFVNW
jgi:hypothetical protein